MWWPCIQSATNKDFINKRIIVISPVCKVYLVNLQNHKNRNKEIQRLKTGMTGLLASLCAVRKEFLVDGVGEFGNVSDKRVKKQGVGGGNSFRRGGSAFVLVHFSYNKGRINPPPPSYF